MPIFDYEFDVQAPLTAVQEFHHDTTALKKLTPPPTIVQIHSVEPMANGSISRFTLWLGPYPIHWTAEHRDVGPHGFTDVQVSGPAAKWEHTHTFSPLTESTTRITEHIEFEHQAGRQGLITRSLFAKPNLLIMFTYRKLVTRWHLRHA